MNTICNLQVNIIKAHPFFEKIVNNIIGDMLMNKVHELNGKLLVDLQPVTLNLIYDWYFLAMVLNNYEKCDLIVYRGVKRMQNTNFIYQPIPFSTCIDFTNSLNWVNEERDDSYIMEIEVNSSCLYTFTGNFAEGNEVILPAGYLIYKKKTIIEKIKVITFIFEESKFTRIDCFAPPQEEIYNYS
jgi:hypothetical protein